MQPEVVFFYGPPFSVSDHALEKINNVYIFFKYLSLSFLCLFKGKDLFYCYHFSHTHEKINPGELFETDPGLSLRAVILKIVNVLNKVIMIGTSWDILHVYHLLYPGLMKFRRLMTI